MHNPLVCAPVLPFWHIEMTLANALCAVSKFQIERARVDGNDERGWGGAWVLRDRQDSRERITSLSEAPVLNAVLGAEPVEVLW
jgi:hypothetical protein